jgi:hypothetical protein
VHRFSQTGEEAVDVGVSSIVDSDIGMAVLCEAKMLEGPSRYRQVLFQAHEPRISPRATFSELILQASSCAQMISFCSDEPRHRIPEGDRLLLL